MHRVQYTEAIRIHGRHLIYSHESIEFRIRIFGHLCGGLGMTFLFESVWKNDYLSESLQI